MSYTILMIGAKLIAWLIALPFLLAGKLVKIATKRAKRG